MNPVVSICCTTYNHERFIGQALDGFLMQRTSFPFEIIIHDDCSTDGTADIIREYQDRHPDLINAILQTENQYSKGTKIYATYVWPKATGQYIAMCEGDDYWTDPLKLQKQVDFLEAHPECSMCFHEAYDLWPDGRKVEYVRSRQTDIKPFYGLEDVVAHHFIPTASMVFRNGLISEFPQVTAGDWMLHVMLAEKGALAFLDENWSIRRIHPGGVASMATAQSVAKHVMLSGHHIDQYLERRLTRLLRPMVTGNLVNLCIEMACSASDPDLAAAAVERTIDQYAQILELTPRERREVAQETRFRLIFRMRDRADMLSVRKFWFKTLGVGYRAALLNCGYWSIGIDALVGEERADPVHHLLRRLK
jgi:glycosyltransferase involved in cell wall biosynthesis